MPMHTEIKTAILNASINVTHENVDPVNPGHILQYVNEAIASILSDQTVPFCFVDAGLGWDRTDRNFTYPQVTAAEIELADMLPVPHARMLIETKVEMSADLPEIHCICVITRIGACGYSAKPMLYKPRTKELRILNTVIDYIPGRVGDNGVRPKMNYQLLNKQNDYFDSDELDRLQNLLSRFLCIINRSKTCVRRVQADAALNLRRRARGKPEIRDYHVVRLGDHARSYLNSFRTRRGTSPCEHRRRSHSRTYKSGKIGIVRNSIVNAGRGPNGPVPQVFVVEGSAD